MRERSHENVNGSGVAFRTELLPNPLLFLKWKEGEKVKTKIDLLFFPFNQYWTSFKKKNSISFWRKVSFKLGYFEEENNILYIFNMIKNINICYKFVIYVKQNMSYKWNEEIIYSINYIFIHIFVILRKLMKLWMIGKYNFSIQINKKDSSSAITNSRPIQLCRSAP